MNILIKDNPVVSIILSFKDGAKLAYCFKEPVAQGKLFAVLGATFGKMGIEMPALEIPPQPGEAPPVKDENGINQNQNRNP